MNFFGLMNFQAPYLPWVLCGFSILLGGSSTVDLMGKLERNALKFAYFYFKSLFQNECFGS